MANLLAVVTGASSGIGLSLAKELASRGYDLIVCSSGERLTPAADSLDSLNINVTKVRADLSMRKGVESLWNKIAELGRPVNIACINAGIGVGGEFWETNLNEELK